MSTSLTPLSAPVALAEVPPAWLHLRRELVLREGNALRAGPNNTIEAKTLRPDAARAVGVNEWRLIRAPGEGIGYASAEDRDAVLEMLLGERGLPEVEETVNTRAAAESRWPPNDKGQR